MRAGFVVQFISRFTGYACFADWPSKVNGLFRSTTTPEQIAFWDTRDEAIRWLERFGLKEFDPVPIGIGHMNVSIRPFDLECHDPSWCRGSLFEIPRETFYFMPPASQPAAATPLRAAGKSPRKTMQLGFTFGD